MANFTSRAIKYSLLKLLNEQPISKITVKSIAEDCGINRNSFYYHFSDIPALIEEIVKELIDELIQKYPTVNSIQECIDVALNFAQENKKLVYHIYNSANRDIFERYTMELCEYLVKTYITTVIGEEVQDDDKERFELAVHFLKCEIFGIIYDWISSGMSEEKFEYIPKVIESLGDIPERIAFGQFKPGA